MAELHTHRLLDTGTVSVRHVLCAGNCRQRSAEESADASYLAYTPRGTYVRHVGNEQSVADANHVLFYNAAEAYRVSHPVAGGDASLVIGLSPPLLHELLPAALSNGHAEPGFRVPSLRIDARAQALVALLRHALAQGSIEMLEAEGLSLTLVSRTLGPRTSRVAGATPAKRRLVDRVKVLLASDLGRRWTLAEIGQEIGGSAVYLTQSFQQVEGLPLYRYQLRLRLARALDRIVDCADMSALALDLGFSSHSHFTAAFRQAYGRTPTAFRASITGRSTASPESH